MNECIIHENVNIGEGAIIGHGTIIYPNTTIGNGSFIGPYSIIGEPSAPYYKHHKAGDNYSFKPTMIGARSVIRSHSVIYEDVSIGDDFQSGHRSTIRENTTIGNNCSIGTATDIQNQVKIGNHVRIHSNVFMGQLTTIEDFVWIYPAVVFTNDPLPPMGKLKGATIKRFAQVFASATVLPGIIIGQNALVGAHSVVTKNVDDEMLVVGNPAKVKCNVRDITDADGNQVYPWKEHLEDYRGYPWQIKK
jgi:acetyltransferase-like isoleucine patch superfamily enzyme